MLKIVHRGLSISGSFSTHIPSAPSPLKIGPIRGFGNWPPEVYRDLYDRKSVTVEKPSKKVKEAVEKHLPQVIRKVKAPKMMNPPEKDPIQGEEKKGFLSNVLDTFTDLF